MPIRKLLTASALPERQLGASKPLKILVLTNITPDLALIQTIPWKLAKMLKSPRCIHVATI